jgi:hypothetical protein
LDCFRALHPFDEAYVLGTFAGVELQSLGQDSSLDTLDLWRQEFNYERPHEALGMRCPAEIYQNSNRKYGGSPQELIYPGMATRNVNGSGQISWQAQQLFITTSLAGWSVGLKISAQELLEVWFARLLLGWVDPTTASLLRADIRSGANQ